jgi:hypothetical protein
MAFVHRRNHVCLTANSSHKAPRRHFTVGAGWPGAASRPHSHLTPGRIGPTVLTLPMKANRSKKLWVRPEIKAVQVSCECTAYASVSAT